MLEFGETEVAVREELGFATETGKLLPCLEWKSEAEARAAFVQNDFIGAIRILRNANGLSLKQSKEIIDDWRTGISPTPKDVQVKRIAHALAYQFWMGKLIVLRKPWAVCDSMAQAVAEKKWVSFKDEAQKLADA